MSIYKKVLFPFIFTLIFVPFFTFGQVKTINPCLPAMSNTERDTIQNPTTGTMLFNTSSGCINVYSKGKWKEFCEQSENPKSKKGMVEFDSSSQSFNIFDGAKWIAFEEYAKKVKMDLLNNKSSNQINSQNGEYAINQKKDSTSATKTTSLAKDDCMKKPSTPYAGKDIVSIKKEVNLDANRAAHGMAKWRLIKGDSGIVVNPSDPKSLFSGKQGVTYTLRWEISTKCDTLFDEVLVRIRFPCDPEPSISMAGIDQRNVVECFLNANPPDVGEGNWTIVEGIGGVVTDPKNPRSELKGVEGETYLLRWIVRTKCGYTQDDVKISFKPPCKPKPSPANAGPDQFDQDTAVLAAVNPDFGEGRWIILSGKNGRFESRFTAKTKFYGLPEETYLLKWEVTTECGVNTDTVKIHFRKRCPLVLIDDRDGNKYAVFQIGEICWLAGILNYHGVEYFCYDDDPKLCDKYGALYKWVTAMNGSKKSSAMGVCPKGWHVPSDEEWDDLNQLVKQNTSGMKLSNNDGYNMQYGGMRYDNGDFSNKNQYAFFWSSTVQQDNKAWNRYYNSGNNEGIHFSANVENGFSVRCVMD